MDGTHLARRLRTALSARGDAEAIAFVGPDGLERRTGGQLREEAEAIATELLRDGAMPEANIRILPTAPCRELAVELIGTMLAGVVPLVLDAASTNPAAPALGSIRDSARSAGFGLIVGSLRERHEAPAPQRASSRSPLRVLQTTSGTTSAPRLCMWGELQILAGIESMAAAMAFAPSDISFCWTSLGHTVGLANNLLLCLLTGGRLALMDPDLLVRAPRRWLEGLTETEATITWTPNFAIALTLRALENDDLAGIDLARVRAIWNAGERIDVGLYRKLGERLAQAGLVADALRTNYGCGEHGGGATFSGTGGIAQWNETLLADSLAGKGVAETDACAEPAARRAPVASVGTAAPGVEIRICEESGRELGDGEIGEITLRASSTFLGYLGDHAATAAVLRDGVLWTGDRGYLRDGRLFWVGRSREAINVRGRKYDPDQFREVLAGLIDDRLAFVAFGVDDERSGTQGAVLVVEAGAGVYPAALARSIRRATLERLGINLKDIVVVAPGTLLPTASGKKRHAYYRDAYLAGTLRPQAT
jgi:acyl-CoA synthetase (AMP-forming)/AMP-acid ligase II